MNTILTQACYTVAYVIVVYVCVMIGPGIYEVYDSPCPDMPAMSSTTSKVILSIASAIILVVPFIPHHSPVRITLSIAIIMDSFAVVFTSIASILMYTRKRNSILPKGFLALATVFYVAGFVFLVWFVGLFNGLHP